MINVRSLISNPHPLAGQLAPKNTLINATKLTKAFYDPGTVDPIKFGTSGLRGTYGPAFNIRQVEAVAMAVANLHWINNSQGPVLVGGDTRLMSAEVAKTCAEILAGGGISVILAKHPLPTPVFSSEIINGHVLASLNATASHNPPADLGLKYNPETGGPADPTTTNLIEDFANFYLKHPDLIRRMPFDKARDIEGLIREDDFISPYVKRLAKVIDFEAIKQSGLKIGIHPLGGTSLPYFEAIADAYGLDLEIVDRTIDPTFWFVPLDHDGQIRMDPSSEYPMRPLLELAKSGKYDLLGATDPDADRFGVVTKQGELISPNQALSIAFDYLLKNRPNWPTNLGVGLTISTTHFLNTIARANGRPVDEKDVGFKYFVEGLRAGHYALAGEESAGLSIYNWTTEKDGIMAVLLMAEIMAKTGRDLGNIYQSLVRRYGQWSFYKRIEPSATKEEREAAKSLRKEDIKGKITEVAHCLVLESDIRDTDGIKLYLKRRGEEAGWILIRPSGTEPVMKIHTESFISEEHRQEIEDDGAARLMEIVRQKASSMKEESK